MRTPNPSGRQSNVDYHDLGGGYFTRRDPERGTRRITHQANALGFTPDEALR